MISTPVLSAGYEWVKSDCQHSSGWSAWNRRQELLGRFFGSGAIKPAG
jgi:hypothetical protein